jgi:ligand-binding SRPBCC domain-containing protein
MKIYNFRCEQKLPIDINMAWNFFSSPDNLSKITPPHMGFEITGNLKPEKMYAGQIISYTVKPLAGIPMTWVTEITHVNEPFFFVDEQRFGPYRFWHHQHHFREIPGGVMMSDIIHYAIPMGPLGAIANSLIVKKELENIFGFRKKTLESLFGTIKPGI